LPTRLFKGKAKSFEKEIVMKNIVTIAILLASTCIGAGNALAQSERVNVVVPFSFTINSTTLPAGTYSISNIDSSPLIKIDNLWNTRVHVLAMGQAPLRATPAAVHSVVFHKCGSQYFLSDVRGGADSLNLHIPTSKAEKRAQAEVQEAGLRTSNTVLVALR
jgi:hypothetical protein